MRRVSESAMKAVWTAGDARQIPGLRHSEPHFGNSLGNCKRNSLAAGYADIGIFRRILMETVR